MKKIGILTYSYGTNYGGTLQCIGLYKILKIMGFEAQIINYMPKTVYCRKNKYILGSGIGKNVFRTFRFENLKKFYIKLRYVDRIIKKFDDFREKNSIITEASDNLKELIKKNNINIVIVGSDQVWSGEKIYFLNELNDNKIKKISYAACSGKDFFKEEDREYLTTSLKKFYKISVRNEHTRSFVERLIGNSPDVVCDPSILYDYNEFLNDKNKKEKYILTYILGEDIKEGNAKAIEEIKKIFGNIKVIAIGIPFANSGNLRFYPWADEVSYDASPEEWLNLINNAEFVYTDSYHGALFSMKFHKPFLAYYTEKNRAPRFIDLAKRYNVDKYIVNTLEEAIGKKSISKEINYEKIDLELEKHRKDSMEFLKKALED